MNKNTLKLNWWGWLLALPMLQLGVGVVFAQKQPAAARQGFVSWNTPARDDLGKYSGTKGCLEGDCHSSRALQMAKTVHTNIDVAGFDTHANCESCHGPGKEHTDRELEADRTKVKDPEAAKLIFAFTGSPAVNSERCLACHTRSEGQDLYGRSEHKLQAVACNDCHEPHYVLKDAEKKKIMPSLAEARYVSMPQLPEERRWLNESLLKTTQTELCSSCHGSVRAQFSQPNRHKVIEGAMKCTDCHNAHGSLNRPLTQRSTVNETCTNCHAEKRGPFVFEHASVKVEGCTYCHSPHGSTNQHRLKRGETRFLCVSCHRQHGDLSYQWSGPCTRCHVTIHGSNSSPYFVK